jgi:hypothetical protein
VVDQAGNNLNAPTKANAKIQAALLAESSTVIKGVVKEGKPMLRQPTTTLSLVA